MLRSSDDWRERMDARKQATTALPNTIAACMLLSLLTLHCDAPELPVHRPFEADPASASAVTADDMAVYEAIISAYADAGEVFGLMPPPPDGRRPLSPKEIESASTRKTIGMLPHTELLYGVPEVREHGWFSIEGKPAGTHLIPPGIVSDFAARNRRKTLLANFTPKHLRVTRSADTSPFDQFIIWSLPGYSPARNAAIVEVSFISKPHGGGAQLIYLKRTGGVWRFVAQHLTWVS